MITNLTFLTDDNCKLGAILANHSLQATTKARPRQDGLGKASTF